MRINLPVTQREQDYPDGLMLVSTTDTQGRITHCNEAFVRISGFSYEELLGQPHHMVRHPDMPPEAFQDMWRTIGHGRPWSGVVKNRCKNGDHYWVLANVTPVLEKGKPVGYMSVRLKPTRQQIQEAEQLYARLATERESGRRTIKLHAGGVRRLGWRNWPAMLHRLTLSQRLALMLTGLCLAELLPLAAGWGWAQGWVGAALHAGLALGIWAWFHGSIALRLREASRLAAHMAGCNLTATVDFDGRHPLGKLMRRLWLINLNTRAIVEDVRAEVRGMTQATREIAAGSHDLCGRTEQQAANLQETASTMDQIHGNVAQTAQAADQVIRQSHAAGEVAERGGQAVGALVQTMQNIEAGSRRMSEIVQVIEGIAFQTNILALNAAVEAARAGESGRGFAVVAGEVRQLAGRTAQAVREVSELIGASHQQVDDGARSARSAEQVIGEVIQSVLSVRDLVTEITGATREQSEGIAQVNQAIAVIDQATQQNAALVEQTAAASHALDQRADTLIRSVQIFRAGTLA
ncbi:PAS domain-containing protein [Ideonella dechloratans]|uniref:PAS domain-containing protein n=1 Tax=Ideonella dechloratans TaxID=36863 RepID=A0A643FFB5_IDEDE|nr:PAS domain-containing methyl-accepting chemotaxis protein [Ideonella dechloratans]KAB0583990.1 PAS domain-containing protein [Ideonella dechloratans]UFU12522.1 methyl-accepting chemotaxis protein [Ideonella dechloratans]